MPPLVGKAKPPINVVGDVGGRIAIMVDDMIDDVKSFIDAAHILKERGAYKIYALATHGILSADAPRLIQESPIDEVRSRQCYQLYSFHCQILILALTYPFIHVLLDLLPRFLCLFGKNLAQHW